MNSSLFAQLPGYSCTGHRLHTQCWQYSRDMLPAYNTQYVNPTAQGSLDTALAATKPSHRHRPHMDTALTWKQSSQDNALACTQPLHDKALARTQPSHDTALA